MFKLPLHDYAKQIRKDWKNLNPAAKPYVDAMAELNDISDNFYHDTGKSVVLYFLANAGTWRGEEARRIKKELNDLVKAA